ncbi:MAG: TatD family hydrolase [Bacteroidales bacterium]|nr:TatD family hydrolase [Bacteroidales bacterium]
MKTPLVDIHTHTAKTADDLIQIVNLGLGQDVPEQGLYSYGVHPWALDNADFQLEEAFEVLEERLQSPNVLALGEAGLDKMHKESYEQQIAVFEIQIDLSETLQKPMILHDVKSHNEILALRKKHKAKQPWILHGFDGTEQDIRQLTGQGLYFSVGESLMHSERKIAKSLKSIPLELLFLETDMAEIGIESVYDAAVKLLDLDINTLRAQIFTTFAALWNIGKTEPAC